MRKLVQTLLVIGLFAPLALAVRSMADQNLMPFYKYPTGAGRAKAARPSSGIYFVY